MAANAPLFGAATSESLSLNPHPPHIYSLCSYPIQIHVAAYATCNTLQIQLLQATSDSSAAAAQLKRSLCKSMAALGALASFLEAAANEAACLAEQLAPSAPAAAALPADAAASPGVNKASPLPRAPSMSRLPLGRALRMAELGRVERLMADAAALLLNVVDAADLFAAVGRRNSGSGLGVSRSGWSGSGTLSAAPESSPAAPAGGDADAAAAFGGPAGQAATEQLSPITRLLLPAVAALGRWWRARAAWSAAEAELANPQIHVDHLAQVRGRGRGGGDGHPGHRCKGLLHLRGCHGTGHCRGRRIAL